MKTNNPAPILVLLLLTLLPLFSNGQEFKFKADLDPFIELPGAYKLNQEHLQGMFNQERMKRNPYFQWLDQQKTRAIFKRRPASNVEVDLTILNGEVPIQEMVVDFKDGQFLGVTISVFNRGDAGKMSQEDFKNSFTAIGRHLGTQLAARPNRREGNLKKGLLTSGYTWISARGMAVLEYNPSADQGKVEFLRMRLCQRNARGSYAAAMKERAAASVRTSELPSNIKRDSKTGNIYVDNIPMVDQGGKGYCVVASVQRLFEYYGVPCDMHQLAEIVNADPNRGTSSVNTAKELGAIDHLFKMRYECFALRYKGRLFEPEFKNNNYYVTNDTIDSRAFGKIVRKSIDKGIPLLWSLSLGQYPEEPPISPQADGGHMRLIIGYNDKNNRILFSDSWGAGHEVKSMQEDHARKATSGLYLMKPVVN